MGIFEVNHLLLFMSHKVWNTYHTNFILYFFILQLFYCLFVILTNDDVIYENCAFYRARPSGSEHKHINYKNKILWGHEPFLRNTTKLLFFYLNLCTFLTASYCVINFLIYLIFFVGILRSCDFFGRVWG